MARLVLERKSVAMMAMLMVRAFCEEMAVPLCGFMVGVLKKEECEEQAEQGRRHVAAVHVYGHKRRRRKSIFWSTRKAN